MNEYEAKFWYVKIVATAKNSCFTSGVTDSNVFLRTHTQRTDN